MSEAAPDETDDAVPIPPRLSSRHSGSKQKVLNLERKRQTDRESQRIVRERTKRYISYLENLVETLQKGQQDERLHSMAVRCEKLREENEQLRNSFTSISRIIRGVDALEPVESDIIKPTPSSRAKSVAIQPRQQAGSDERSTGNGFQHSIPLHTSPSPPHSPTIAEQRSASLSSSNNRSTIPATQNLGFISRAGLLYADTSPGIEPSEMPVPLSIYGEEDTHVFVMVNNLLSRAAAFTIRSSGQEEDADIAIRAIALGWPLVEQRHELDPGWQVVRQIEQEIFCCCGPVEKLALLRILRLKLLQKQVNTSDQQQINALPSYMHARPIQDIMPHAYLIDYFVWPELREFLILNIPKEYPVHKSSNHIAAAFASSLRFRWPFDVTDAWRRNRLTDSYSFSQMFDESFNDVSSWGLTQDFFELYPELKGYIPIHKPDEDGPSGT